MAFSAISDGAGHAPALRAAPCADTVAWAGPRRADAPTTSKQPSALLTPNATPRSAPMSTSKQQPAILGTTAWDGLALLRCALCLILLELVAAACTGQQQSATYLHDSRCNRACRFVSQPCCLLFLRRKRVRLEVLHDSVADIHRPVSAF